MAEKNKLRKYIISYHTEVNDECVDREIEVEAINEFDALLRFKSLEKVFKKVHEINEIPNTYDTIREHSGNP